MMGQFDGSRHARAEPNAVIRTGNVIVHGLGDRDDLDSLFVQSVSVTQRVVAADGNEIVDAQEVEVLQNERRDVVGFIHVGAGRALGNTAAGEVAGTRAGRVKERAPRPGGAGYEVFAEFHDVLGVVGLRIRGQIHQSSPSPANAEHPVALTKRPHCDGTDRRVQPRNVPTAGENSNRAFVLRHPTPFWKSPKLASRAV